MTDDGATQYKVGTADANVNLYGIDSDSDEDIYIAGGGGTVFEYVDGQWETTNTIRSCKISKSLAIRDRLAAATSTGTTAPTGRPWRRLSGTI